MPDVRAQLIISARDEASATMKAVASSTAEITPPTKAAGLSLMDLYAGVRLVEMGFRAVKGAYDSVITPSIELADKTRALQNSIGATAEEAGKLIYAADQADVSFATLSTGLKAAIRTLQSTKSEGIAPTIEGLSILADKYNAIADPIERTTFLMHNFGRSGADLATLMLLGGDGIRKLGEEAITTGAILDQKGVTSLHNLDDATKRLNTSILGLKVSLAELLAPALINVIGAYTDTLTVQERFNAVSKAGFLTQEDQIKIWKSDLLGGIIGTKEAALAALEDAEARLKEADAIKKLQDAWHHTSPVVVTAIDNIAGAWDSYTTNSYRASAATYDVSGEMENQKAKAEKLAEHVHDVAVAEEEMRRVQRSWLDGEAGDVIAALRDAGLKAGDYERALRGVDKVYGTSFANQDEHKKKIAAIIKEYQKTGDIEAFNTSMSKLAADDGPLMKAAKAADALWKATGNVIATMNTTPASLGPAVAAFDGVASAARNASRDINSIHDKTVTVTSNFVNNYTNNYTDNGVPGAARGANGLDMIVPPGFPNDSYPIRVQSGEHVKVTPAGKGDDATLTALLTNLPGMIARAVRDGMQR